jgi:hypothetical protein
MDANLKLLKQEVEKFKNVLGSYEFAPKSDSAKKVLIIKSEKFPRPTDRAALLDLLMEKLKKFKPVLGSKGDASPSSNKIGSSAGGIYFVDSVFQEYIIEAKKFDEGGTASITTAQQETYSALCIAAKFGNAKTMYSLEDIVKYSNRVLGLEGDPKKLFQEIIPMEWKQSSKFQTEKLFKSLTFIGSDYTVERQQKGPISKYIYKLAKKYIKELTEGSNSFSIFAGLQLDKWNPGDVWIIKKTVKEEHFKGCTSVKSLNEKILELFKKRHMFPVSLKKAEKENPPFEISNDGDESFKSVYRRHNLGTKKGTNGFQYTNNNMLIEFTTKNSKSTDKSAIVRPFTGDASSFEIEGEAAAGGKAGITFLNKVLKTMNGTKLITDHNKIKDKAKRDFTKTFIEMYDIMKKGRSINAPKEDLNQFISGIINAGKKPKNKNQIVSYINAKYQAIELDRILNDMNAKQKDEFVDKAAAYASSTIKEVSSVFAKVGN